MSKVKFKIGHHSRNGFYVAFGLVEGDCEEHAWVPEDRADTFTKKNIGQVLSDLARAGVYEFRVECVGDIK